MSTTVSGLREMKRRYNSTHVRSVVTAVAAAAAAAAGAAATAAAAAANNPTWPPRWSVLNVTYRGQIELIELNIISFIFSLPPGSRDWVGGLRPQIRILGKSATL